MPREVAQIDKRTAAPSKGCLSLSSFFGRPFFLSRDYGPWRQTLFSRVCGFFFAQGRASGNPAEIISERSRMPEFINLPACPYTWTLDLLRTHYR